MGVTNLPLQAVTAAGAIAVLGYLVSRVRRGRAEFTLVDALIIALATTIVAATVIPLVEAASHRAQTSALLENLRVLRTRIELYKAEHGGQPPLLHEGSFPQLIQATNQHGVPGPPGTKYPLGPYLRDGVPINPISGRSIVTSCESFPPQAPSGNEGWLFHQPSGQIAPDLEGFLQK